MQEIVWGYQPDLIVETGVARGGSLIFYASLLELIGNGEVLGIDIDIRKDNRAAIEGHPLFKRNRIRLIEGSSVDPAVVSEVHRRAATAKRTLVVLDSNHTHEHVLAELRAYAPLVRRGGHLVVMDTTIEDAPENLWPDRPWSKGNNPKTAVQEFLADTDRFEVDRSMQDKLLITVALGGYLRCIKDPA
jgi:cephalosporin hydroxylase